MSWFKVDDHFHSHPKVVDLPLEAAGLWVMAGSWSMDQLTDGFVPRGQVRRLGGDDAMSLALIEAGLWIEASGGFQFHEWDRRQKSKDQVLNQRASWAARQKKSRAYRMDESEVESRTESREESRSDSQRESRVSHREEGIRNREEGSKEEGQEGTELILVSDVPAPQSRFDEFWAAYPRKVKKPDAQKAWAKALKKAPAVVIIARAAAYRDDPNREDQYTAHPATWLNADSWNDEPLPARGGTSKAAQRSNEVQELLRGARARDAAREAASASRLEIVQ